MIGKDAKMTLDLKVEPTADVFPMRVVINGTRYEFNARVTSRRRMKRVDRFSIQVVGSITMKSDAE